MGLITRLAVLAIAVLAFSPPGSLDAAANTGDVITFCKAFIPACGEVCVQYYPKDQPVVAKCQPAFMQTWKANYHCNCGDVNARGMAWRVAKGQPAIPVSTTTTSTPTPTPTPCPFTLTYITTTTTMGLKCTETPRFHLVVG